MPKMTEEQIRAELASIKNDPNISEEERKIYTAIFEAELVNVTADAYISAQRKKISELRIKVINELLDMYPNLDEEKQSLAGQMLFSLATSDKNNPFNPFKIDDYMGETEVIGSDISMINYLDYGIHKELEELDKMHTSLLNSIDRKYLKLEEALSDVIDPEVFNFESKEAQGEYKTQSELDSIFAKENHKIDSMDIGAKEKGMLRQTLISAIKHGTDLRNGKPYEPLENLYDYVRENTERLNQKL